MFSLTSRNITSAMRRSHPTPVQQWSVFLVMVTFMLAKIPLVLQKRRATPRNSEWSAGRFFVCSHSLRRNNSLVEFTFHIIQIFTTHLSLLIVYCVLLRSIVIFLLHRAYMSPSQWLRRLPIQALQHSNCFLLRTFIQVHPAAILSWNMLPD